MGGGGGEEDVFADRFIDDTNNQVADSGTGWAANFAFDLERNRLNAGDGEIDDFDLVGTWDNCGRCEDVLVLTTHGNLEIFITDSWQWGVLDSVVAFGIGVILAKANGSGFGDMEGADDAVFVRKLIILANFAGDDREVVCLWGF
ncbi:MAG: hypothetical protein RLZZ135_1577 [Cyanobacteriota bacterium]